MGYVFSPFVMSRLNTRPQFIAALIISAVAQVSITLITDWVILCQSRKLQSWPLTVCCQLSCPPIPPRVTAPQVGMGLSLIMPCPILSLPCLITAGLLYPNFPTRMKNVSFLSSGLTYGLGVGPVPFVTMSALFPQVSQLGSKIVFLKSIFSEKSNARRTFSEIQDHWDECWADNKSHGDCVYIVI